MNEVQQAVGVLLDAALRLLQDDPHQWSDRPCPTCRPISSIIGKPFGCYEYQRRRAQNAKELGASPNKPSDGAIAKS
jgi:hypothetical protein